MMKPLEGLKVLDLTRLLAGSFCSMILGDLGADVIKIEKVNGGDDFRSMGPFLNGESAAFLSVNRNKKSMTLNLRSDRGKKIFLDLVPHFDIVVENFRPGVMNKLGLGYEVLRSIHPGVIYASVSGFGQTGPLAFKAAYDFIVSGYSGIMSINAHPGGEPVRLGIGLGDAVGGMFAAIGILAAVRAREINGEGACIDISMLDSLIALLENPISRFFATRQNPEPSGNQHPYIAPMGVYKVSDGFIVIAVGNDKLWASFCKAIERVDLVEDSRFATNTDRINNLEELREVLGKILHEKQKSEWLRILDEAGIPCGPLNTIAEAVDETQVRGRNMIVEMDHPTAGAIRVCGTPVKIEGSKRPSMQRPPLLGEFTKNILQKLLYLTSEEIESLKRDKVI
ncbi:MAG: CoA transferase [Deltaproteobacteria bacterium]|nr:CoA transferase [Deltaproteobacteria bacterium]MBW2065178.1 CoA transferase [Deltaproteobacteria bacterium]